MKRHSWVCGVLFVLLLAFQFGCQKAGSPTNSPSADTNSAQPAMDKAAIEAEVLRIENDWPRVLKEKDVAAVRRLEAEDAVFVYPDGTVGDKAQDVKDME